jgi:putative protease
VRAPRPIGKITHYFDKICVGIIKLLAPLSRGEYVRICGHGHDFIQRVDSMQLNHKDILKAKRGWEIGIKTDAVVKEGDLVFAKKGLAQKLKRSATGAVMPAGKPARLNQSAAQIFTPLWAQFKKRNEQQIKESSALPPAPACRRPAAPSSSASSLPASPPQKADSPKKSANWGNVRFLSF